MSEECTHSISASDHGRILESLSRHDQDPPSRCRQPIGVRVSVVESVYDPNGPVRARKAMDSMRFSVIRTMDPRKVSRSGIQYYLHFDRRHGEEWLESVYNRYKDLMPCKLVGRSLRIPLKAFRYNEEDAQQGIQCFEFATWLSRDANIGGFVNLLHGLLGFYLRPSVELNVELIDDALGSTHAWQPIMMLSQRTYNNILHHCGGTDPERYLQQWIERKWFTS